MLHGNILQNMSATCMFLQNRQLFLLNNMKTLKKFSKNDLIFWMLQGTFLNLETTGFYGLACMSLTLGHPVETTMQFHAWNHMVPCHSIRESHTVSEVQNVESIRTKYLKKINKNYS